MGQEYKCRQCGYRATKNGKLRKHLESHIGEIISEEWFNAHKNEFYEPASFVDMVFLENEMKKITDDVRNLSCNRYIDDFQKLYDSTLCKFELPIIDVDKQFDNWEYLLSRADSYKIKDLSYSYYVVKDGLITYKPYSDLQYHTLVVDFYRYYLLKFGYRKLLAYANDSNIITDELIKNMIEQSVFYHICFIEGFDNFLYDKGYEQFDISIACSNLKLIVDYISLNKSLPISILGSRIGKIISYYFVDDCNSAIDWLRRLWKMLCKSSHKYLCYNYEFLENIIKPINDIDKDIKIKINDFLLGSDVLLLDWKFVEFYNGKVALYHPNEYNSKTLHPLWINESRSRRSFNDIKKYLKRKSLGLIVKTDNNRVVKLFNVEDLIKGIEVLYLREETIVWENRKENKTKLTQKEIIQRIKDSNDEFLNFLCDNQLDNFLIYYCPEKRTYESFDLVEDAYIFVLKEKSGYVFIVYENTLRNNASYCFILEKFQLQIAIDTINFYFSSPTFCKRSHFNDFCKMIQPYVKECKRVPHNKDWKRNILFEL